MEISSTKTPPVPKINPKACELFLCHASSSTYKQYLHSLYGQFDKERRNHNIPFQSGLADALFKYGPFSKQIDTHIQTNGNLKDELQRNNLRKIFVDVYMKNTLSWKNEKGKSFEEVINEFEKNVFEKYTYDRDFQEEQSKVQQSLLLQEFQSIEDNIQQKSHSQSGKDIFVSIIDSESQLGDQFVDIPMDIQWNPSNSQAKNQEKNTNSQYLEIELISEQKFNEEFRNRKGKKIRKFNKKPQQKLVKEEQKDQMYPRITESQILLPKSIFPHLSQQDHNLYPPYVSPQINPVPKYNSPVIYFEKPQEKHLIFSLNEKNVQQNIVKQEQKQVRQLNDLQTRKLQKQIQDKMVRQRQNDQLQKIQKIIEQKIKLSQPNQEIDMKKTQPLIKRTVQQFFKSLKQNLTFGKQEIHEQKNITNQDKEKINHFKNAFNQYYKNILEKTDFQDEKRKIVHQILQTYQKLMKDYGQHDYFPQMMNKWILQKNLQSLAQLQMKIIEMEPVEPTSVPIEIQPFDLKKLNQQSFYFNFFQFFDIYEQTRKINLSFNEINEFVNLKEIIRRTKQGLQNHKRLNDFCQFLKSDLSRLSIEVESEKLKKYVVDYFYKQTRPLNQSLGISQSFLPFTISFYENENHLEKFVQNQSQQKQPFNVISMIKLQTIWNSKKISNNLLNNKLYISQQQISETKRQIILQTIKATIQDSFRIFEQIRQQITRGIVTTCAEELKKIGLIPQYVKFHLEQSPFFTIHAFKVMPLIIDRDVQIELLLNLVSSLINKKKIIQSVETKRITKHTQTIASSLEYILKVKKQFVKIQALNLYASKCYKSFGQNIDNKQFLKFIAHHFKFNKFLQSVNNRIELFSQKGNTKEFVNHAFKVLYVQMDKLDSDFKKINLSLSKNAKVMFHYYVVGVACKLTINQLQQEQKIRKETIEEMLNSQNVLFDNIFKSSNEKSS